MTPTKSIFLPYIPNSFVTHSALIYSNHFCSVKCDHRSWKSRLRTSILVDVSQKPNKVWGCRSCSTVNTMLAFWLTSTKMPDFRRDVELRGFHFNKNAWLQVLLYTSYQTTSGAFWSPLYFFSGDLKINWLLLSRPEWKYPRAWSPSRTWTTKPLIKMKCGCGRAKSAELTYIFLFQIFSFRGWETKKPPKIIEPNEM